MHPYSTDGHGRTVQLHFYLAVSGLIVAWGINTLLHHLGIVLPWFVDWPSAVALYEGMYALFRKRLWRAKIFRTLGLVGVPDLNGTWKGQVESWSRGRQTVKEAQVVIHQTLTEIAIFLETPDSRSFSLSAHISLQNPNEPTILYHYFNEPRAHARNTMHAHRGSAFVKVQGDVMTGEYYTGRDRKTHGSICLQREVPS